MPARCKAIPSPPAKRRRRDRARVGPWCRRPLGDPQLKPCSGSGVLLRCLLLALRGRNLERNWSEHRMSHGSHVMRRQAIVLAAALFMAPLGARAADLVVWWEKGFYPQEDEAVAETVAAFEQRPASRSSSSYSHKMSYSTRLRRPSGLGSRRISCSAPPAKAGPQMGLRGPARRPGRHPPTGPRGRAAVDLFDADVIEASTLLNGKTGQRGLYALPMGRSSTFPPCLEHAPGARRLHSRRHSEGVGCLLVVLVRPGAAGSAQGAGTQGHLGRRAAHVGSRCQRHLQRARTVPARV